MPNSRAIRRRVGEAAGIGALGGVPILVWNARHDWVTLKHTQVHAGFDHDNGIRWPMTVAPYHVHLVPIGKEDDVLGTARELYAALEKAGVEVLWDDRDERPGVKFKDADLIGIPMRVTIGAKGLATGNVALPAYFGMPAISASYCATVSWDVFLAM